MSASFHDDNCQMHWMVGAKIANNIISRASATFKKNKNNPSITVMQLIFVVVVVKSPSPPPPYKPLVIGPSVW